MAQSARIFAIIQQIAVVALFVVLVPMSNASGLHQAEHRQLVRIAVEIIERFPPDKFVYLGVGASPSALIATLQLLVGQSSASTLPLGGLQNFSPNKPDHYGAEVRNEVRQVLHRFVPDSSQLNGRQIVLIDYIVTGRTLLNAFREIRLFLREARPDNAAPVVQPIALVDDLRALQTATQFNIYPIRVSGMLATRLQFSDFDQTAPFLSYKPRNPAQKRLWERPGSSSNTLPDPAASRPAYRQFKGYLRGLFTQDPFVLDQVARILPDSPLLKSSPDPAGSLSNWERLRLICSSLLTKRTE